MKIQQNRSIFGLIAVILTVSILGSLSSAADNFDRWEPSIKAFEAQDKANLPVEGDIMFLGSSSIRMWKLDKSFPGLDAVNRGFGGSEIADSVHFFDRIVMPHKPRLIVMYAGDNDIAKGKTPERVAEDFRAFTKLLDEKLPETRLIYVSIKLCKSRWGKREQVNAANALIEKQIEKCDRFEYFDPNPYMMDAGGEPRDELFLSDRLHLSAEGYKIWNSRILPLIEKK